MRGVRAWKLSVYGYNGAWQKQQHRLARSAAQHSTVQQSTTRLGWVGLPCYCLRSAAPAPGVRSGKLDDSSLRLYQLVPRSNSCADRAHSSGSRSWSSLRAVSTILLAMELWPCLTSSASAVCCLEQWSMTAKQSFLGSCENVRRGVEERGRLREIARPRVGPNRFARKWPQRQEVG